MPWNNLSVLDLPGLIFRYQTSLAAALTVPFTEPVRKGGLLYARDASS